MVTKRALSRFKRHFSQELRVEEEHFDIKENFESSQFKFSKYMQFNEKELHTQIEVSKSIHSSVEFMPHSCMISKLVIEEGVDFNLNFYAHPNSIILLDCEIKKGAKCNINGYYSANEGKIWMYVKLLHVGEGSHSNLYVLGYSSNNSECVNDGLVQIGREAQHSSGYQTMNNYVLSQQSKVFSEPQLEIFNPNVECSHGCTISPIDKEVIYYLQSRGLEYEESVELLQYSMYNSFLQKAGQLEEE
ncbi:MAG: SufB/SufD family protein [Candidatus Nanoarchaeia archaeon]